MWTMAFATVATVRTIDIHHSWKGTRMLPWLRRGQISAHLSTWKR